MATAHKMDIFVLVNIQKFLWKVFDKSKWIFQIIIASICRYRVILDRDDVQSTLSCCVRLVTLGNCGAKSYLFANTGRQMLELDQNSRRYTWYSGFMSWNCKNLSALVLNFKKREIRIIYYGEIFYYYQIKKTFKWKTIYIK